MNRNQKIALGCGAAGCLGLIVAAVVCVLLLAGYGKFSFNVNRNSNFNANTRQDSNTNSLPSNSSSDTASSVSDDEKHRLFQAASASGDHELMNRVMEKIGLGGNKPEQSQQFMQDHLIWVLRNTSFIKEINTPEKARAYVNDHIKD